ncbi:hypothetical protein HNR60_001714 [Rhodopseudomonas rhenobacensis]|uniref:Uncharacterized protein n=1 Tax=Rhodopseudomonas rhenobacensis TaxID=87461 RepID=A0A7W7Z363_9BRAD|nr:hypothetical protein [Rhodopseudomonas rhenobacensis]MBB5046965.1 hypothetical protein [Rhodopseudomonas rhenobacensis]
MVKDSKTTKKKPAKKPSEGGPGRPRVDPGDLRTDRIAFRIHPDLTAELNKVARLNGEVRTAFIERLMIATINNTWGYDILDAIGRRIEYPEDHPVKQMAASRTPFQTFAARSAGARFTLEDFAKLPPAPKRR